GAGRLVRLGAPRAVRTARALTGDGTRRRSARVVGALLLRLARGPRPRCDEVAARGGGGARREARRPPGRGLPARHGRPAAGRRLRVVRPGPDLRARRIPRGGAPLADAPHHAARDLERPAHEVPWLSWCDSPSSSSRWSQPQPARTAAPSPPSWARPATITKGVVSCASPTKPTSPWRSTPWSPSSARRRSASR